MSSLRLKKICDLVDYNSIVADIGTDHGIIPIELSKKSISKKIIATDISKDSLEKLEQKLLYNNNIANIDTRVSDGLDCIEEFEVAEISMIPQNEVTLSEEDKVKFERMLEMLDDCEDVQQVYHNVNLD